MLNIKNTKLLDLNHIGKSFPKINCKVTNPNVLYNKINLLLYINYIYDTKSGNKCFKFILSNSIV